VQHATIERVLTDGIQAIDFIRLLVLICCCPAAKAVFRSTNAAEMLQHGLQQTRLRRGLFSGLAHRKFHCAFKDSSGK
jgi:hypothetical protein